MAASDALGVQDENLATAADAGDPAAALPGAGTVPQRLPRLIPIAQLVAVILGVFAIIWNQQQTTDSLRSELRADIGELRAEIGELRAGASANGQLLARIEGSLGIGIGIPDPAR